MILPAEDRARLTEAEDKVLTTWLETRNRPPLSAVTAAKFFELFLHGTGDCAEICRLNESLYPLGMILEARVGFGWDRRRDEYLSSLYSGIADRARQAQLESVGLVSDMMAATAKLHGDKVKKYLQTGDEELIKDLPIKSMSGYKTLIELLLKLTGQDKGPAGTKVNVMSSGPAVVGVVEAAEAKTINLDSGMANKFLALLEEAKSGPADD